MGELLRMPARSETAPRGSAARVAQRKGGTPVRPVSIASRAAWRAAVVAAQGDAYLVGQLVDEFDSMWSRRASLATLGIHCEHASMLWCVHQFVKGYGFQGEQARRITTLAYRAWHAEVTHA